MQSLKQLIMIPFPKLFCISQFNKRGWVEILKKYELNT